MTSSEQHISVTNLFPPANVTATVIIAAGQTDGQFAIVCDMRRERWGLYSRKVVNGGR